MIRFKGTLRLLLLPANTFRIFLVEYSQEEVLYYIPKLLLDVHNEFLQAMPTLAKLKVVVFSIDAHLVAGLDG